MRLLVTGREMGAGWSSAVVEGGDDHESGDLCGTTKEGETNQLGSVSAALSHDDENAVQGAVQHEIARYKPGTARTVAAAITARLRQCKRVEHDFDGDKGLVTVTPTAANKATFSVDFGGGGGTTFGALVVSQVGDYVSTSTSFAIDTKTAAALAAQLDVAARKKLAAA